MRKRWNLSKTVGFIFAAVFIVTGLCAAGSSVGQIFAWARTQSWIEQPATIESAEREINNTGHSEDYWSEIHAEYEYEFNGKAYRGNQVAKHPRSLQRQSEKTNELEKFAKHGKPTICYVNPNKPQEAVLYRELNVASNLVRMAMGSVFILLPASLLAFLRRDDQLEQRYKERQAQHPNEPWRWQNDWAAGLIEGSKFNILGISAGLAIVWNLFSLCLVLALWKDMQTSLETLFITLCMPVAPGIGLIGWYLYNRTRREKFGKSSLQLGTLPGVVGGPFSAVVRSERELDPAYGVRVTLSCHKRTMRGAGKNRHLEDKTLWQDTKVIAPQSSSNDIQSLIPFQFAIPFGAKQTEGRHRTDGSISWELEVAAEQPGIDYKASFTVPVFQTESSSPDFQPEESPVSRFEQVQTVAEEYRRLGIRRKQSADGLDITFPMFRNVVNSLLGTFATVFIGSITLGGAYACWHENISGIGPGLLITIGALFSLLLLWACLDCWFHKTKIRVSKEGVAIRSGWLGLGREQRFSKHEIESVFAKPYGPNQQSPMFDVVLKTHEGKTLRFGKRIADLKAPHAIAADIAQAVGIEAEYPKDIAPAEGREFAAV